MSLKSNYSYLSYIILALFIAVILFFPSIVSAATLTPRSAIDNFSSNNKFDYTGIASSDERPQENWTFTGTVGTTYSRQLFGVKATFNYSIVKNHTYRITISDSSNNFYSTSLQYFSPQFCFGSSYVGATSNCVNGGLSSSSSGSVSFLFSSSVNASYFRFTYGPITDKDYYLTNSYSFNLSSFTIDDLSSTPTSPTNQDVINNDNQNTSNIISTLFDTRSIISMYGQDILNSISENSYQLSNDINNSTNLIIDNQNSNTEQIETALNNLDSDITGCNNYLENEDFELNNFYDPNGNLSTSGSAYGTLLFLVDNRNSYYLYNLFRDVRTFVSFFDSNKQYLGRTGSLLTTSILLNSDTSWSSGTNNWANTKYISITIFSNNSTWYSVTEYLRDERIYLVKGTNSCNGSLQNIYDYISDGNIDSNTGSSFFNNFQVNDFGLTAVITAPLNAIQQLTSSTCSPLVLPIPFTNSTISLPCMSSIYSSKIPTLYNLWQIVSFGIIAYYILQDLYRIIRGFRDPDQSKLEVLDL